MGVFSGLFQRAKPRPASLYVSIAEARVKQLRHHQQVSLESFSSSFLFTLSRFAHSEQREPYGFPVNDSVLFEIGCYDYFLLDLWLFNNHRQMRESIATHVANDFASLSAQVFGSESIGDVFDSRLAKYAEIERREGDNSPKKQVWYLKQLILRVISGSMPRVCDPLNEPIVVADLTVDYSIEVSLMGWTIHMVPALVKSMDALIQLAAEGKANRTGINPQR